MKKFILLAFVALLTSCTASFKVNDPTVKKYSLEQVENQVLLVYTKERGDYNYLSTNDQGESHYRTYIWYDGSIDSHYFSVMFQSKDNEMWELASEYETTLSKTTITFKDGSTYSSILMKKD